MTARQNGFKSCERGGSLVVWNGFDEKFKPDTGGFRHESSMQHFLSVAPFISAP